jgi:hypothetical protein
MSLLILTLVFLFMIFYVQCYFKPAVKFELIQTTLGTFKLDYLFEKQPIYIYDRLANPADLFTTIFKYQYINHSLSLSNSGYVKRNLSKYCMIYNDDDEETATISLQHPNLTSGYTWEKPTTFMFKNYRVLLNKEKSHDEDANKVRVLLKPRHCLIVPLNWVYHNSLDNILEIHLFDLISKCYSFC